MKQKFTNDFWSNIFLDPNGNCPLVSGMYYDNRNKWHIRQEFFFEGKHVDVGYVLDLFSRPNTKIFNKPYIEYNDDTLGDNSQKVPEHRLALASFINQLPISTARLFSLLAIINGPRENWHFTKLSVEFFCHPRLFLKFLKKVMTYGKSKTRKLYSVLVPKKTQD